MITIDFQQVIYVTSTKYSFKLSERSYYVMFAFKRLLFHCSSSLERRQKVQTSTSHPTNQLHTTQDPTIYQLSAGSISISALPFADVTWRSKEHNSRLPKLKFTRVTHNMSSFHEETQKLPILEFLVDGTFEKRFILNTKWICDNNICTASHFIDWSWRRSPQHNRNHLVFISAEVQPSKSHSGYCISITDAWFVTNLRNS